MKLGFGALAGWQAIKLHGLSAVRLNPPALVVWLERSDAWVLDRFPHRIVLCDSEGESEPVRVHEIRFIEGVALADHDVRLVEGE